MIDQQGEAVFSVSGTVFSYGGGQGAGVLPAHARADPSLRGQVLDRQSRG